MREGMFDRAPLSGLAGGVPVLDFRKAPGSRGGKAGEAARFLAALRAMAGQQNRDTFSTAELQVRCCVVGWRSPVGLRAVVRPSFALLGEGVAELLQRGIESARMGSSHVVCRRKQQHTCNVPLLLLKHMLGVVLCTAGRHQAAAAQRAGPARIHRPAE